MKTVTTKHAALSGRQRRAGLIAVLLLVAALAGATVFHRREPLYQGRSVAEWVQQLGDNSYSASRALREIGPEAVPSLIAALKARPARWLNALAFIQHHSPRFLEQRLAAFSSSLQWRKTRILRTRPAAAQVLGDFGAGATKAVPALLVALHDRDSLLRRNAAFALGKIGSQAERVVPALNNLLRDPNDEVRMYAAIALKRFGPEAANAVPALVAMLKDRSWQVRERAALALGAVGQDQAAVVAALEEALQDEHRFVRSSAATALASLAPRTKAALTALAQARYDPDAEVRYNAGLALEQISANTR